jgi:hypothetical protein
VRAFGLTLLCLVAMSSQVLAQYSLFTPKLFCRAVADAVATRQAVALGTGEGKYDRHVSSAAQCFRDQALTPGWAPSADNASCFIGYTCEPFFDNRR